MIFDVSVKNKKSTPDPAQLLQVIGHPDRRMIIELLTHHEPNIAKIQEITGHRYITVYKHLQYLEEVNFITSYKVGKDKYYVLNEEAIKALKRWVAVLTNQLRASHANYQHPDQTYHLSDTEQIGGHRGKEHWYRQGNV